MPYPNEHAARVKNPSFFDPDSFRSKELKDGIRLILGKLKSGNGSMVVQAYRFPTNKFTVEQAKKWLEDNKIKYASFEPAKPASETGGSMEKKIEHAGVLGMKWGTRRGIRGETAGKFLKKKDDESGGTKKSRGIRGETAGKFLKKKEDSKKSDDFKRIAELRKKKIDEMSNEEISTVIKRMDLQKRYKDVNPSKVKKGSKAAGKVLGSVGQISAGIAAIGALAGVGQKLYSKVADNILANVAKGANMR